MVAREGFVYEQKPLSVTRNVVVWEGWSLVRVVVRQGFYCTFINYIELHSEIAEQNELKEAKGLTNTDTQTN